MRHARLHAWRAATIPLVAWLASAGAVAPGGAQTPPPSPALTRGEMAEFLRTADVVSSKALSTGVTKPLKMTLSDGSITHDAVFQAVDQNVPIQRMANGHTEINFRDSYHFNIAASGLAELLGLGDMVPATVERKWEGRTGSLAWWIDWKWDETIRMKENLRPPDPVDWAKQQNRMRVFSELVYDTDRNTGNQLITEDWHLWMVDFTRAFRVANGLFREENVQRCDRSLLSAIKALTPETVASATAPHLLPGEIKALLKRRDRLVARIDTLVKERGENLVLY